MKPVKMLAILAVMTLATLFTANKAEAYGRHYYGGWNYHPRQTYYYTYYYYKPVATYSTYSYHYCISYPSRPRYVYYYNPVRRSYWGRYDLQEKGYSMLAEADRKENLKDIPESAFPKPAAMPGIPESKDGERMLPPPVPPKEAPKKS